MLFAHFRTFPAARVLGFLALACTMACTTIGALAIAARAADTPIRIVAFGDSLTAGFMLPPSQAFPAQLQVALTAKGYKVEIVNAGVSGDTTGGGLHRLEWTLEPKPDGVILELGANDALRGIEPKLARENLDKMLSILKDKGADVLLAGIKAPTNFGPEYQASFDPIFTDLAAKYSVPLYPFFLDGVLGEKSLVMDDGLHPTGKGVAEIVKRILPEAEALVKRIAARKSAARD